MFLAFVIGAKVGGEATGDFKDVLELFTEAGFRDIE